MKFLAFLVEQGMTSAEALAVGKAIERYPGELFITRGKALDVDESDWKDSGDEGSEFTVYTELHTP
jgi:hypothetical protein